MVAARAIRGTVVRARAAFMHCVPFAVVWCGLESPQPLGVPLMAVRMVVVACDPAPSRVPPAPAECGMSVASLQTIARAVLRARRVTALALIRSGVDDEGATVFGALLVDDSTLLSLDLAGVCF